MATDPQSVQQPLAGGAMSVEDYFRLEQDFPQVKYEYINGVARLMSGGSIEHEDIALNVIFVLRQYFQSGPCHVRGDDVRVLLGFKPNGKEDYVYPDATVSCDVADRRRGNKLIRSPRIVFEVLSPSTEQVDRTDKLRAYQACPSIQEIVLINQFAQHVEIYRRESEDASTWKHLFYGPGEEILLESVDVPIPMSHIYQGINFDEPLVE